MAVRSLSGVRASEVNPSFLHANSTSHTWIFSAIAELIDNAYDPDVAATQLWIEKRMINGQVTLVFVDNGNGMDPDRLHKMLSFGFSDKQEIRGHRPIGQYGNGFKSGSMRLGKDVLVFTRQRASMSVGFLSQSYLQAINAKTVFVPIATWRLPSNQMVQTQECYSSLKEILRHSIFRTERSIIQELDALGCIGHSGTEIIIYNLKRDRRGNLELDFESDPNDILNPQTLEMERNVMFRPVSEPTPAFRRSLREYCSILYLKPRMKIMLRGEKVKTKLVSKSLSRTEKDVYKPHFLPRPVKIIFGFSPNKNEDYGILMYHKNRLIIAYEKVGYQKQANELGVGIVGVVELNFLEPIHNKQDFNKTTQYNSCVSALGQKLNEYWNEKMKGIPGSRMIGPGSRPPDWLWAQCDKCLKWRRLPPTVREGELPKKWFCHMNLDATRNRCNIPEEAEDEDDMLMRPSYEKTFKKQMEERKRLNRLEQLRELQKREKELQLREEEMKRMRMNMAANPPRLPNQPNSAVTNPVPAPTTAAEQVDVKPNEADLLRAQRELTEAKQRESQQTQLIQQLQQQKDLLEKRDVFKIAESITLKHCNEAASSPKALESGGAGQKRPLEGDNEEEGPNKRVRVVTSDGEVVYVVEGDKTPKPLIDLTLSDEENEPAEMDQSNNEKTEATAGSTEATANSESSQLTTLAEEERDMKPDLDELDRRILEAQKAMGMVPNDSDTEKATEGTETGSTTESAGNAEQQDTGSETTEKPNEKVCESEKVENSGGNELREEADSNSNQSDTESDTRTEETNIEKTDKTPNGKSEEAKKPDTESRSENGRESAAGSVTGTSQEDLGNDDFGGEFPEDEDDFIRDADTPSEAGSKAAEDTDGNDAKAAAPKSDESTKFETDKGKNDEDKGETAAEETKEEVDKSDDVCAGGGASGTENGKVDEKDTVKPLTNGEPLPGKAQFPEIKPKLNKIVQTRGVQTLPVEIGQLLPDSYNFSKLAPSEIHHLLVERTNKLEKLRRDISELLRILLPDADIATPDSVDRVVQEVIQVNRIGTQLSSSPSK